MLFIVPAAVALLLKLWILASAAASPHLKNWRNLLFGFLLFNAVEIVIFTYVHLYDHAHEFVIRTYYVFSLMLLWGTIAFISDFQKDIQRRLCWIVAAVMSLLSLLCYTDLFFTHAEVFGYSARMVKTSQFWILAVPVIVAVSYMGVVCWHNYKANHGSNKEIRAYYNYLSVIPYALVMLICSVGLLFNQPVNAGVIMPFASTAFLFFSLYGIQQHEIKIDARIFTEDVEREQHKDMLFYLAQFNNGNMSYQDVKLLIDRALIKYALAKNDSNISAAARSLGISRATLARRAKKYLVNGMN